MNALDSTWGLRDSTAHNCIELIRRHAPLLMKVGDTGNDCVRYEFDPSWGGKRPKTAKHQKIIALGQRGEMTLNEIADTVGVSYKTVRMTCNKAGIPRRRGGRPKRMAA